ncbi:Gfo/Idh/MocA family oxidoreductase [PVC group bacterium]|nr:Gfo/Idh/MocA family oxidoreductase [PVC group bacterium]
MTQANHKIRVGIVGTGFGQQVHAPIYTHHDACELVAIASRRENKVKEVAKSLGLKQAYSSWQKMLDEVSLDAISIATPPAVQSEIALAAMEKNIAVFCEKPLALSWADGRAMVQKAHEAQVPNMVDYEFPEIPEWQSTKKLIDSGKIGKLRHIALSWNVESYALRHGKESWKTRREEGGGTLYPFVSHVFYYIEWLAGPIKKFSSRLYQCPDKSISGDTLNILCLEMESGAAVSLSVSIHAFLGTGHRLEFYGEDGTILLQNTTSDYIGGFELYLGTRKSKRLERVISDGSIPMDGGDARIWATSRVINRFIDWIRTGKASVPSFKEGLRVQYLLEKAKEASKNVCWVDCAH